MSPFPRDPAPDSTLALMAEGYTFVSNRCERLDSDVFETRLALQKAICAQGESAARMFYQPGRFTRRGAMPPTTLVLLQDRGSVQSRDGEAHLVRKQMLMSLMSQPRIEALVSGFNERWNARLEAWEAMDHVVLHHEAERILCDAVCRWAGVPLDPDEVEPRTRELAAMIDGAGSIGPRNWRGQWLRARSERWTRRRVRRARAEMTDAPAASALRVIAGHREMDGQPLRTKIAGVELLNILRPTVAVARYVTFIAHALHIYPEARERVVDGGEAELEDFVQEVRRFYPFFPLIAGRVREPFEWRDHAFDRDDWILLDLYGTNRDARLWEDPDRFQPERFSGRDITAYELIPQGGGDFEHNHRCAGEWITIELMKAAARQLATQMRYDVPEQDLSIDLSRMPAVPKSRFIMRKVRRA